MRRKPTTFQSRYVDDVISEGDFDNIHNDDDDESEEDDHRLIFDSNGEKIVHGQIEHRTHTHNAEHEHEFSSSASSRNSSATSDKSSKSSSNSQPRKIQRATTSSSTKKRRAPFVRSKTLDEEESSREAASHAARILQRRRRVVGIRGRAITANKKRRQNRKSALTTSRRVRRAPVSARRVVLPAVVGSRRSGSAMLTAHPSRVNVVTQNASRVFYPPPREATTNGGGSGSLTPNLLAVQPSMSSIGLIPNFSTTCLQAHHYPTTTLPTEGSNSQQPQIHGSSIVYYAQPHLPATNASPQQHVVRSSQQRSRRHSGHRSSPSPHDHKELVELTLTDLEQISAALSTHKQHPDEHHHHAANSENAASTANTALYAAANQRLASLVECTSRDDVVKCYSEYRQRCDEAMSQIAGNCLAYVCVVLELHSDNGSTSSSTATDALERRCNAEKIAIFSQTMRKILLDLRNNVDSRKHAKHRRSESPATTCSPVVETESVTITPTNSLHNVRVRLTHLGTLSRVFHHLLSKADDNRLYDIDLNMDSIEPLLAAAKILRMDFVQAMVARFVLLTMNEQRCLHFLRLALQYKMRDLVRHSLRRAQLSFGHLLNTNEWLVADPIVVLEIVRSRQLNCAREQQVYDAVMLWLRREPETRKAHVEPIMLQIRFQELNKFILWKAWAELRVLVGPGTCAQLEDYIIACAQFADIEMRRCLGPPIHQLMKEPRIFSANPNAASDHHHGGTSQIPSTLTSGATKMARHPQHHPQMTSNGLDRCPPNTVPVLKRIPHPTTAPFGQQATVFHRQPHHHHRPVTISMGGGIVVPTRTLGLISNQISRPQSPSQSSNRAQSNQSPGIMDMPSLAAVTDAAAGATITPIETQSH